MRFGETKNSKNNILCCQKKTINIWDANIDNIVISKLIESKTDSKYSIAYVDKTIRKLVLTLPKMRGCVKIFKVKDGDKNKSNKLVSFRIDDVKLLEKYKTI